MNDYAIGLDIGIASVGWAVLSLDSNERPNGIIDLGSRVFDAAEVPKTGASLAADRRLARSARRILRRRRHRNERIRRLIVRRGLLSKPELDDLFASYTGDIYLLRTEALDRLLNAHEFARVLVNLAQRRGFRSNRKNVDKKSDDGKMLTSVQYNYALMQERGYRTVGEMYYKDDLYAEQKHNKGGSYIGTVSRDMMLSEIKAVFEAQRSLGNPHATQEIEQEYIDIWAGQRNFDEGPGEPSPYAGNQIEKMVGRCSFYPEEYRAAKAAYSFQYFSLLQYANSLRIKTRGSERPLSEVQRSSFISLAFKKKEFSFGDVRKAFNRSLETAIEEDDLFNTVNYTRKIEIKPKKEKSAAKAVDSAEDTKTEESPSSPMDYTQRRDYMESSTKIKLLSVYHELLSTLGEAYSDLGAVEKDAVGTAFTLYKSEDKIRAYLLENRIPEALCDKALENITGFSGFGRISLRACRELIPYLEKGMVYSDACDAAGLKKSVKDMQTKYLRLQPEDVEDLTSPVVKRSVAQTVKVLNAIIRKRGKSPMFVNVELAREMSKSHKERQEFSNMIESNRKRNDGHRAELEARFKGSRISGQDMLKSWLYEEQGGKSAYSPNGTPIDYNRLLEPGYLEIDHIIPYSKSFDDTMNNKVLVFAYENRDKGNKLPLEYLTGKERETFIEYTSVSVRNMKKRANLLKPSFTQEDSQGFRERNLTDTRTVSRFILDYLQDNLAFAHSETGRRKRVTAVNGAITAFIRKQLGINKIREDGDIHHAVDAVLVGCITDSVIRAISEFSKAREEGLRNVPTFKDFPQPWDDFRAELDARTSQDPVSALERRGLLARNRYADEIKPIYVSRMSDHKVTGPAHKDTLFSKKLEYGQETYVRKKKLTDLTIQDMKNIYNRESDILLYDAIEKRLNAFGGKGKEAFKEPLYKPKADGTKGPIVKGIKIKESHTACVELPKSHGFADNDTMVCIDVYRIEGKGYYFVPVYITDVSKGIIPDKACIAHKPNDEWKIMDGKDYVFSLFRNDLIRIKLKKNDLIKLAADDKRTEMTRNRELIITDAQIEYFYYKGADITNALIKGISLDGVYVWRKGILNILSLEKCSIDVLGNITVNDKKERTLFG